MSSLENPSGKSESLINAIVEFVNTSELLPHGSKIQDITTKSVKLLDAAGSVVSVDQMSDGYRSVLSLTFELLRQMFLSFGDDIMLHALQANPGVVSLPGIVAIDEIDAHLHPTWQTRIGDWFLDHFPAVQFFVTTHSPLVCRAAKRGSIWRLPTPGSNEIASKITGQDFDRLVGGNVLDAYGTDFFGKDVDTPEEAKRIREKIARLAMLQAQGQISAEEAEELKMLQAALPTSASTFR